jgi:deoxycytidylate deaminase
MNIEAHSQTYGETLFAAKRGFLIIGFTGYTGSGCTTAATALIRDNKLALPSEKPDNKISVGRYSERRFEKLKAIWEKMEWEPFTSIEIGVVIFAILAKQVADENPQDQFLIDVKSLSEPHSGLLSKGLQVLDIVTSNQRRLEVDESDSLVQAYEKCGEIFKEYKRQKTKVRELGVLIKNLQTAGDKIRMFGKYGTGQPSPKNMLVMPEAIRKVISAYRKAKGRNRFVIDAFRNPFEVEFFRRRYEEFYLIGVFREDGKRTAELRKHLSDSDIRDLKTKEDGKLPTEGLTEDDKPKNDKDNIGWWVTGQNIPECSQKADVFVKNRQKFLPWLHFSLIKTLALINKPGCLTPSNDEHNMQIASTARLMSGCLSRQVGASLVGEKGYILGIGWNDPPRGQVPCSLRSCGELLGNNPLAKNDLCQKDNPFSEFEKGDKFTNHIENSGKGDVPFCFRVCGHLA